MYYNLIVKKKIKIQDIDIYFLPTNLSKSIRISINEVEGVRVFVPLFVSFISAKSFVISKINWIKGNVAKIEQLKSQKIIFKPGFIFNSKLSTIQFKIESVNKIQSKYKNNIIDILIPKNIIVTSENCQLEIRNEIEKILRNDAKIYLPKRVKYFAEKFDFNYKKVVIKNAKTRWGSCSSNNNINLNLHLMRLVDELIDYVILHELVHTKIKNHQKQFWDLLNIVSGDAKVLDSKLKKYHINNY